MNRLIPLLGLLVGLPFASLGQGVQSSVDVNRVFTHADTVQALHDMYRNGRCWGRGITALAPVAAGVLLYSGPRVEIGIDLGGTGTSKSNGHFTAVMIALPATITCSLVGLLSWSGNSKIIEQETIRNYENRLPLSRRAQRRLHRQLESNLPTTEPSNR